MPDLESKLFDPITIRNIFWSVVNCLVSNEYTTNIPPILENGTFITSFDEKAGLFNDYFAAQCQPLANDSTLPVSRPRTLKKLSIVEVDSIVISSIIGKLNSNKAHGLDDISVSMLKLAKEEVSYPLKLIFQACLTSGKYPTLWKKANVQAVHKKSSRQDKTNYRPISLLPICSKIFEKILFNSIYNHFHENKLLSKHQSGFRPGDSTINQLLAITHDIYESFESGCETRALFPDISKAFDKVWHDGLILKVTYLTFLLTIYPTDTGVLSWMVPNLHGILLSQVLPMDLS